MVVPESSHDGSCSKESPKTVPPTITIPESDKYSDDNAKVNFYELVKYIIDKTDSGIVMVDGTFFGDSFEQDESWATLGRPFQGFRVSTKILQGPGCQF